MGPMLILFGASALVLWVAFIVVCVCIIVALENESPGWASVSIAATMAALWFFTDFSLRYDVRGHVSWQTAVLFLTGYVVCGVVWSFFKWYLELSYRRERWDEAVKAYRVKFAVAGNLPVNHRDDKRFETFIKSFYPGFCIKPNYLESSWRVQPKPTPDKNRIMGWMIYWPWSLLWSLIDDLITGVFKWVYRQLVGVYEAMAEWMFKGIE